MYSRQFAPEPAGFSSRTASHRNCCRRVRIVAKGEALLAPSVTQKLITAFAARPRKALVSPAALADLTDREREVMALVAAGRTNEEIGEELVITSATAKTHVSRAMAKLGARDRAQLVVIAYETGLVTPGR